MMEFRDILPSPLIHLVLPHPVPNQVCEMQTPALFTIAQSSPQPTFVDTINYARVNPLLSPATPSSRGRGNSFAPTQGIIHRAPGPNVRFHQFTNPLGIQTIHAVHVPERMNCKATPPQQTLKPTASCCSLGQLEN